MFITAVIGICYKKILKPVLFMIDPEQVHEHMTSVGEFMGRYSAIRKITGWFFNYKNTMLEQTIGGIKFNNPIGLAAGFDKDARLTQILPSLGFGFEEIGSITALPCPGNPGTRLWRAPQAKSILVYYGLKNPGSESVAAKLQNLKFEMPVGISIARTNIPETNSRQAGIDDYATSFQRFQNIGDYITVNISCPNTCGGEQFVKPEELEPLLNALDQIPYSKPVFIKLSTDLSLLELDYILEVISTHRISGLIFTNLTKDRSLIPGAENLPNVGGFSGLPTQKKSDDLISYAYKKTNGRYVIIGCGGIFTAEDAYRKIKLGASLVQLITGMIYEGPQLIGEINRGLVELLKKDGYQNISEAVGAYHKIDDNL